MPSISGNQQIATAIAEHAPGKLYARNRGLLKMSRQQLHDFASTPRTGLPKRVKPVKSSTRGHGVNQGIVMPNPAGHGVSESAGLRPPHLGHKNIVNPRGHVRKLLYD